MPRGAVTSAAARAQTGSCRRRFTVVAIRKLPEEVEASGNSTQKIRELVEVLSDQVGVKHEEGPRPTP